MFQMQHCHIYMCVCLYDIIYKIFTEKEKFPMLLCIYNSNLDSNTLKQKGLVMDSTREVTFKFGGTKKNSA